MLGVPVPEAVRAFHALGRQLGGDFVLTVVEVPYTVAEFVPLDGQAVREWRMGGDYLPIASDGCGNPYLFRLRDGKVLFAEEGSAPEEVATSFDSFVAALRRDPDA